jgi:hypothetical protein
VIAKRATSETLALTRVWKHIVPEQIVAATIEQLLRR